MIEALYIFIGLMTSIICHEMGHLLAAIWCGVGVDVFSIGFGKPYLSYKIKKTEIRITPWLLGGFVNLKGELTKAKNGFLAQKYRYKFIILTAGVAANLLIAVICYWLNYGSVLAGLYVDYTLITALFLQDPHALLQLFRIYNPNDFLLQLELINIVCFAFNLLPIPALDGGFVWLLLLEKKIKKFPAFLAKITRYGFIFLTIAQLLLVIYVFFI